MTIGIDIEYRSPGMPIVPILFSFLVISIYFSSFLQNPVYCTTSVLVCQRDGGFFHKFFKINLKEAGLGGLYAQHDHSTFPTDAMGVPWTSAYIEALGDFWADLESDMAAEQRARATYEHLMNMTNDPDVLAPLSFLRQREIVHYTRFKELRDYYFKKFNADTKLK